MIGNAWTPAAVGRAGGRWERFTSGAGTAAQPLPQTDFTGLLSREIAGELGPGRTPDSPRTGAAPRPVIGNPWTERQSLVTTDPGRGTNGLGTRSQDSDGTRTGAPQTPTPGTPTAGPGTPATAPSGTGASCEGPGSGTSTNPTNSGGNGAGSTQSTPPGPLSVLRNALAAEGISAGLQFQYLEETVGHPGGSYVNRLVVAQFSDGRVERFSADLLLRNPRVAAIEIARMMGRTILA